MTRNENLIWLPSITWCRCQQQKPAEGLALAAQWRQRVYCATPRNVVEVLAISMEKNKGGAPCGAAMRYINQWVEEKWDT
jgi:hypothetical protein